MVVNPGLTWHKISQVHVYVYVDNTIYTTPDYGNGPDVQKPRVNLTQDITGMSIQHDLHHAGLRQWSWCTET